MKPEQVTKLGKTNRELSNKFKDDIMSTNCGIIDIFLFCDQFRAIRKLDSGLMVCQTYIFINGNLLSYKTENRTKKSITQLSY